MEYRGRVAIVTGASTGIGRHLSIELARRRVHVIGVARREELLRETLAAMRSHEPEAEILTGDVGDPDTARRAVDLARERWGRLDILVNNAGIPKRKHLLDVTPEEAERTIRTNLLGAIYFVLAAAPVMVGRGEGWIVNVSSVAGKLASPREVIYSASKFGMAGLSEGMYGDLHRRGIHTVLVNPGPIDTEIWSKLDVPAAYRGKLYPVAEVTREILRAIEKKKHEVTVPRFFGAVAVLKAIFPGLIRRGADRFDPDRP